MGVASPAMAHDDELKTSPAAGATVDAGRVPITLTFGEELLTGDDSISHEVVVTNEAGEIVPALCASAEGFELSTAAALDQPGTYTVTWRTVSADGHPVDGTFNFKIQNNTDYDAASDAVDGCVYAMAISGEGPTVLNSPIQPRDAEVIESWPGALFIGAGFVVVLVVIAIATRKTLINRGQRRKNKNE